jgi:hypothetical protein
MAETESKLSPRKKLSPKLQAHSTGEDPYLLGRETFVHVASDVSSADDLTVRRCTRNGIAVQIVVGIFDASVGLAPGFTPAPSRATRRAIWTAEPLHTVRWKSAIPHSPAKTFFVRGIWITLWRARKNGAGLDCCLDDSR